MPAQAGIQKLHKKCDMECDTAITFNVLANDTDAEGDTLTSSFVTWRPVCIRWTGAEMCQ